MVRMAAGSQTWPLGDRGADLESLALLPEARGSGIGRSLLEAARREASRRGASTIGLIVMEGNDAARRFYEREGFRPFARLLTAPIDPPHT
jgi:ribosomal protein S18 acetylase RimI-like enzyme